MKRAIEVAKLAALFAAAAALLALTFWILQLRQNIDDLTNTYVSAGKQFIVAEQDLDDTVNDLHKSVLLVPKVINDTRLTLDNANKAAIDERMYFEQEVPGLMARVNLTVDQANSTLAAYQKTGEALTAATQGLQPVELSTTRSLDDLDTLIADPHWQSTLVNLDSASASTADTAKHLDGTTADIQTGVHSFLHPSWKVRMTNWISQAAHTLGGWF